MIVDLNQQLIKLLQHFVVIPLRLILPNGDKNFK